MRSRILAAITAISLALVQPALGHEFWLSGEVAQRKDETVLELDFKVGQDFVGASLPLIPENIVSFEWVFGGDGQIHGRLGDIPAASVPFRPHLGAIISVRTKPQSHQHSDWEEFLSYLDDEGLEDVAQKHLSRDLPKSGFFESFQRHAKLAHVPTNQNEIADRYSGGPLEIVLEHQEAQGLFTKIQGRVVSSTKGGTRLIKCFSKGPNGVSIQTLQSQMDGFFSVQVPEFSQLLLSTVSMREGTIEGTHWHSNWASVFLTID